MRAGSRAFRTRRNATRQACAKVRCSIRGGVARAGGAAAAGRSPAAAGRSATAAGATGLGPQGSSWQWSSSLHAAAPAIEKADRRAPKTLAFSPVPPFDDLGLLLRFTFPAIAPVKVRQKVAPRRAAPAHAHATLAAAAVSDPASHVEFPLRSRARREGAVDPYRINLSWLVRLRYGAIFGQLAVILAVDRAMGMALPLMPLGVILAIEVATNLMCSAWLRPGARVREYHVGLLGRARRHPVHAAALFHRRPDQSVQLSLFDPHRARGAGARIALDVGARGLDVGVFGSAVSCAMRRWRWTVFLQRRPRGTRRTCDAR